MIDDGQLLRRYFEERSQEAFTELVNRHVNLVFFTALRQVGGDKYLADDVTQRVFADLARKTPKLKDRTVLAGWLYTSTRFAAAQAVRAERRRRTHEQEAHPMQEINATSEPDWNRLGPIIDDAMHELNEQEREAILLRYFENQPFAEVGARFSLSADAARMRVDRALEKLRALLAKRGIASTATALATAFASQSGAAAPTELAAKIVTHVLSQTGAVATATVGLGLLLPGAAVGLLGLGLFFYGTWTGKKSSDGSKPETSHEIVAASSEVLESELTKPTDTPPTPTSLRTAPKQTVRLGPYGTLSRIQRSLLKRLWEISILHPGQSSIRWGVKVAADIPNPARAAEIEEAVTELQSADLVRIGPNKGVIFLTKKGIAFCEAHESEINSFSP